ncbi:hypothetical protein BCO26_0079 [Heyndrickxia coagulans 2-6]|nr:hypothetical protein BCO26_0079 [Heyndrickxia coagulans 2-6]
MGNNIERLFIICNAGFACNISQAFKNITGCDSFKIKPLASGNDRKRNFMGLGCCQNKNDMFRGLLKCFQKCVKCADRQHMDFVDNIYFIFNNTWRVFDFVADIPDVIHACIRRRVNLDDIWDRAVCNPPADSAFVTRFPGRSMFAVHRLCQNFSGTCFSCTPRAREKISMRCFLLQEGMLQCFCHMLLPDDIRKPLRPPCAV